MATLLANQAPSSFNPSLNQVSSWAWRTLAAKMCCSSDALCQCQAVSSWAAWSRAAFTEVAPSAGYPPSIVASRSSGPSASARALSQSHLPRSIVSELEVSLFEESDLPIGHPEPAIACFGRPRDATAAVEGPRMCLCSFDFPTVAWVRR